MMNWLPRRHEEARYDERLTRRLRGIRARYTDLFELSVGLKADDEIRWLYDRLCNEWFEACHAPDAERARRLSTSPPWRMTHEGYLIDRFQPALNWEGIYGREAVLPIVGPHGRGERERHESFTDRNRHWRGGGRTSWRPPTNRHPRGSMWFNSLLRTHEPQVREILDSMTDHQYEVFCLYFMGLTSLPADRQVELIWRYFDCDPADMPRDVDPIHVPPEPMTTAEVAQALRIDVDSVQRVLMRIGERFDAARIPRPRNPRSRSTQWLDFGRVAFVPRIGKRSRGRRKTKNQPVTPYLRNNFFETASSLRHDIYKSIEREN